MAAAWEPCRCTTVGTMEGSMGVELMPIPIMMLGSTGRKCPVIGRLLIQVTWIGTLLLVRKLGLKLPVATMSGIPGMLDATTDPVESSCSYAQTFVRIGAPLGSVKPRPKLTATSRICRL